MNVTHSYVDTIRLVNSEAISVLWLAVAQSVFRIPDADWLAAEFEAPRNVNTRAAGCNRVYFSQNITCFLPKLVETCLEVSIILFPQAYTQEDLCMSMLGAAKRFNGVIPMKKLIVDSCRSSGPGGQHVNKRNTKVSVKFHLATADWLPEETRSKLAEIHKSSLNKEGFFTVRSDKTRFQTLNVADCMDKLRAYISEAEQPPPVEVSSVDTLETTRKRLEKRAAERIKSRRTFIIDAWI